MDYKIILLEKKESVATLTLNNPPMNAITENMGDEVKIALDDVSKDDNIGALIITGSGRAFCAGADMSLLQWLKEIGLTETKEWLYRWYLLTDQMINMEKAIIAAINGACAGGGFGFPLGADIVIASEKAVFVPAWIDAGVIPECGANYFLPRMVGIKKAKEICFLNPRITATEAEKMGLINKIVPAEKLMDTAMDMAKKIASKAPKALAGTKSLLNRGSIIDFETTIQVEAGAMSFFIASEECSESVKAFLEKRKPVFKGR
jgi:2-(1,2-epoxy-1,2-dihydrophenyl)acetyl-CoA isomerase